MWSSLVFSIEQNLCRAVSEAEWKIPEHVLICVSVKHLFRSAQAGHDDRGVVTQRAMTLDKSGNCSGQGTSRNVNLSDAANRDRGRQYRISLRMGQLE